MRFCVLCGKRITSRFLFIKSEHGGRKAQKSQGREGAAPSDPRGAERQNLYYKAPGNHAGRFALEGEMATCKICGNERGVEYRERSNMHLCRSCHATTPKKVGFAEFCKGYFDAEPDAMTSADRWIARDFFSDYRTSTYGSVAEYRAATTEPC